MFELSLNLSEKVVTGRRQSTRLDPRMYHKSTIHRNERKLNTVKGSERNKNTGTVKSSYHQSIKHLTGN